MAHRVGLPGSSALQNDGHIVPVILQCRTPQETNPKGHWGPNYFLGKSLFFSSLVVLVCLGPLTAATRSGGWCGAEVIMDAMSATAEGGSSACQVIPMITPSFRRP